MRAGQVQAGRFFAQLRQHPALGGRPQGLRRAVGRQVRGPAAQRLRESLHHGCRRSRPRGGARERGLQSQVHGVIGLFGAAHEIPVRPGHLQEGGPVRDDQQRQSRLAARSGQVRRDVVGAGAEAEGRHPAHLRGAHPDLRQPHHRSPRLPLTHNPPVLNPPLIITGGRMRSLSVVNEDPTSKCHRKPRRDVLRRHRLRGAHRPERPLEDARAVGASPRPVA